MRRLPEVASWIFHITRNTTQLSDRYCHAFSMPVGVREVVEVMVRELGRFDVVDASSLVDPRVDDGGRSDAG
jgi:hypothetical protein